jgi:hypothetical protein
MYPTCPARREGECADCDAKAAAAIRECMSAAQQAVEAMDGPAPGSAIYDEGFSDAVEDALAALAALAEENHAS